MAKYPRINHRKLYKNPNSDCLCHCCNEAAKGFVMVEFDYMRGNDEKYVVCTDHYNQAATDLMGMLDDAETTFRVRDDGAA